MNNINSIKRRGGRSTTTIQGCGIKAATTLVAMMSFCLGLLTGFALAAAWLVS